MNKFIPLAALAACYALPATAQVMRASDYVKTAGASDLFERQSAQTVLQTTADPKVRAFARMMVSAHTKSTAEVKAAAARARIGTAPPHLTTAQARMIAQLRAQRGAARDRTYIDQQKKAHAEALTVQQGYAASGNVRPLKLAASKIVPVVQHHIAELNRM